MSAIKKSEIFSALADPNRLRIVEILAENDSTLLELVDHFSISFQALSKHIKVLESAGILSKKKAGKYRILALERNSLHEALLWISQYFHIWNTSFDTLYELIKKEANEQKK